MEDMDLIVIPSEGKVTVNPLNPNFAARLAKGFKVANAAEQGAAANP